MRDDATRTGCLQLPLGYQYHDQVGREGGQRRAARHPHVAILEEHPVDHMDYPVGALDVRTHDADFPVSTVPFQPVAWKETESEREIDDDLLDLEGLVQDGGILSN